MHNWNGRGSRAEQFSTTQRKIVLRRDAGVCYRCGLAGATEVDHVIPVAEGGFTELSNGRAIHTECHRIKSLEESKRGYQRYKSKGKVTPEPHPFFDRKES